MAKEGPNWDGLLKWSLSHSDGTAPSRNFSEDDRRWFMEAMQSQTVDVVKRMKEITLIMQTPEQVLDSQGVTPQDIEDMLDELQEHVESIDMANDLNSIGGLVPLLAYLRNSHANIRAKAAEVVSTIVQNNPKSQQMIMDANGLEPLLFCFTSDDNLTVRIKALGAITSLIMHNKPGLVAFRLANGYAALRDALDSENVRFQRKCLNLIHYLVQENQSDYGIVVDLGFPRIFMHLASSEDADVREAALQGYLDLVQDKPGLPNCCLVAEEDKLKQIFEERIKGIKEMSADDLESAREEIQLVDILWKTCYDEPSSLLENGHLLPRDDAPPPDVASLHFQPSLRVLAANRNSGTKRSAEDTKPPLLLGSKPSE